MNKPIYLYVTDVFPGEGSWRGGYCYDAVKAMMRDGRYDVRVIRMQGSNAPSYEIDGIRVWPCALPNVGYRFYFPYLVNRRIERSFLDRVREIGIDLSEVAVCHVNLIQHFEYVGTAVKRANPKTFVMFHYHFSGCTSFKIGHFGHVPFVSELYYLYRRHQVRKVDACVYCSENSRSLAHECYPRGLIEGEGRDMRKGMWFAALLPRTTPRRTVVCYNGIDRRIFNERGRSAASDGTYRIGCVANFSEQKGQMTLIQAFELVRAKMPNARLEFVGSGPDLARCKAYVAGHNLSDCVAFHTEVDHTQLPEFYRSLDLFALPSCWWEAFCCVLAEAHACGVPVIGTGFCNLFSDMFSREDCQRWVVKSCAPQDVAEKLLRAYTERPAAQQLTKNLDIDYVIPKFLDWIDANK